MKLSMIAILLLSACTLSARLPETLMIGTEDVPSAQFKLWKASSPAAYAGSYAGDIGGDSQGELKVTVRKNKESYPEYWVDLSYRHATAGVKPMQLGVKNAAWDGETGAEWEAGPLRLVFVTYKGLQGVVVGEAFLPRLQEP